MSFLNDFIDHLSCLLRKWLIKRKNRMVVIRGSCNLCGKCCSGICLHVEGRWLKKPAQFKKLKKKLEYLRRFEIIGKTESGHLKFGCSCLDESGICNDYDNRPELCKRFPAPSIYMQNGCLPDGCGFRMSTEIDFEKILENAISGEANFKTVPPSKPDN